MNPKTSHKIIAAGGMAVVIAVAAVTFAMHSSPPAPVAQIEPATEVVAQIPAAVTPDPAAVPPAPAAAAEVAEVPVAPAHKDSVAPRSKDIATAAAIERKLAREERRDPPVTGPVATNSAEPTTVPTSIAMTPDEQKPLTSTEVAASDSQITTDVKTQIAGDSLGKDANIGVVTTRGVVALTGSLATQDAIDHVKDVAGAVKDVKSVDTSALIVASL